MLEITQIRIFLELLDRFVSSISIVPIQWAFDKEIEQEAGVAKYKQSNTETST